MKLYLLDRVQAVTAADPALQNELQKILDRRKHLGQTHQQRTLEQRTKALAQAEKLEPAMYPLPTRNARQLAKLATQARTRLLIIEGSNFYKVLKK